MNYLLIALWHPYRKYGPMTPEERMYTIMGLILFFSILGAFILWVLLRRGILLNKERKVKKSLMAFSNIDPFWNEKEMMVLAKEIFFQVQLAWTKNHFIPLAPYLSDKIKVEWNATWQKMKEMNLMFCCAQIDVEKITLISAEDHIQDNKDQFSVWVSGYTKRYMKNKTHKMVAYGHTRDLVYFTDIYTFIREDQQWILNDIQYNAGFLDILTAGKSPLF